MFFLANSPRPAVAPKVECWTMRVALGRRRVLIGVSPGEMKLVRGIGGASYVEPGGRGVFLVVATASASSQDERSRPSALIPLCHHRGRSRWLVSCVALSVRSARWVAWNHVASVAGLWMCRARSTAVRHMVSRIQGGISVGASCATMLSEVEFIQPPRGRVKL